MNSGGNATDAAAVSGDVSSDASDIMVLSLEGDLDAASTPQFRRYALQLMVFESPRVIHLDRLLVGPRSLQTFNSLV